MSYSAQTAIARFVNVRAPQSAKDAGFANFGRVTPPRGFKSQLMEAATVGEIKFREEMQDASKKIIEKFTPADRLPEDIEDAVRTALMPRDVNAKAASETIEAILGVSPKQMMDNNKFHQSWHASWESYYANSVVGGDRRALGNSLRAASVISDLASMEGAEKPGSWSEVLTRRVMVPKGLFLSPKPQVKEVAPGIKDMLDKVKQLGDEVRVFDSLKGKARIEDRNYYQLGIGAKPNVQFDFLGSKVKEATGLLRAVRTDTPDLDIVIPRLPTLTRPELARVDVKALAEGETMVEPENWLRAELDKPEEKSVFDKSERALLNKYPDVTVSENELNAVDVIEADLYKKTRDLLFMPNHALPVEVAEAPETQMLMKRMKVPLHKTKSKGRLPVKALGGVEPRVHVLGIGDLIVVEEQIDRYEMGEVAHIENVMAKETRNRKHVRIAETETTSTSENEETSVDEKSLQTTDRFELTQETQSELESSFEVTAGLSVTGGYGPVKVTANTGLTSSTSASSGRSTASTLAREAVEKAVSKVTTRVREEQIVRVLNKIEETNEHGFENDTVDNLTGIYRWVDKYYRVRAVNYGRRLMLEMIVPEPANGFIFAEEMHAEEEPIAPPPPPMNFGPEDVTRGNYLDYAEIYGAVDIPAPPKAILYQTLTYGMAGDGKQKAFVETGKTITIPEGYATTNVYRASWVHYFGDYKSKHFAGSQDVPGSTSSLNGVTGTLQVTSLMECAAFQVGWKVRCELTDEAYESWKVGAWASIKQAYEAAVAAYEEKVAAAAIGAGVHIHGRNPEINKQLIHGELKRAAVKYLSEDMGSLVVNGTTRLQEVFNAADDTGDFDLDEARHEGQIIQFFEQAFEWHNMTYLFYPYFWAKESRHHKKMLAHDEDPAMRDFLSAGAARVVLPVPVEYEDAVLNFFETNEIWNGGEPPLIDDPEYISIAEELKQGRTNSFDSPIYYEGAGTPPPFIVDEWEVKMPTSLVLLQADGTLPEFPAGLFETDAAALLDQAVQAQGQGANWRNSVVDLLLLYGVGSPEAEANRRAFASQEGYSGNADTDAIASVDSWCFFYVLNEVNLNGLP